jgi:signal transduction histidine kinase
MRKDFIANASHELKTPITIIRGFAETLHDNPALPVETTQGITETIVNNCERMAALIKDLLQLADIENLPHSSLQDVYLVDSVQSCYDTLLSVYPDANMILEEEGVGNHKIIGAPDLIEMAIINLFTNAAKYCNGPSTMVVKIKEEQGKITLSFADNGIGIPAQDLDSIFYRFYTVDKAHSRKLGGTGLGLSIVKTIIEKHHGTISVESTVGVGTTFTIVFPVVN